jgi:hypothetical protein
MYHEKLGTADAIGRPTEVTLGGAGIAWGNVVWPEPLKFDQPVGSDDKPTWIFGHKGTITLFARGKLGEGSPAGATPNVTVNGVICTDAGKCTEFEARVKSSGAGPTICSRSFLRPRSWRRALRPGQRSHAAEQRGDLVRRCRERVEQRQIRRL